MCKSDKIQGAEMEDEGNVLKYMTKSEMGKQRSCLLIMTQRLFVKERMLVLAIAYIIIAFSYYKNGKGALLLHLLDIAL